ncbi:hypothetical protein ACFLSJ_07905 [Verrucomicrobiota bacterium]
MFSELDFEQMLRDTAGLCDAEWSPGEIEQIVIMIRLELYNRGAACGPKAIQSQMEESYAVKPLPSERTIARTLAANGLSYGRIGWCDGDEKWLPASAIQAKQSSQGHVRIWGEERAALLGRPVAEFIRSPGKKTQ